MSLSEARPEFRSRTRSLGVLAIAVVTVLLGAQGFATVSAPAVSAGDGTPVTTVSLTWDDGRASQVGTIALHEQ